VFVHCLCWLGAIFSRVPGSHLLIRALVPQGRHQGPPRVRPNKTTRFPIRCPIRSCYSVVLLAHIPMGLTDSLLGPCGASLNEEQRDLRALDRALIV
jgi:hypothetical protein